jgi:hypothetical protein
MEAGAGGATPGLDVCWLPQGASVAYDGFMTGTACGSKTKLPYAGTWFGYTSHASTAGTPTWTHQGATPGCGGDTDCAWHVAFQHVPTDDSGNVYGGVGFDLSDNTAGNAQVYSLASFTGIRFWAKGTLTGTRDARYKAVDNTIHAKIVTQTDRHSDDYGWFCTLTSTTDWTQCDLAFADAMRDGWYMTIDPATDTFDPQNALKVQLQFDGVSATGDASALDLSFDVWIDNVAFY